MAGGEKSPGNVLDAKKVKSGFPAQTGVNHAQQSGWYQGKGTAPHINW